MLYNGTTYNDIETYLHRFVHCTVTTSDQDISPRKQKLFAGHFSPGKIGCEGDCGQTKMRQKNIDVSTLGLTLVEVALKQVNSSPHACREKAIPKMF